MLGAANAIGRKSEAEIVKQPSTADKEKTQSLAPSPWVAAYEAGQAGAGGGLMMPALMG